jgi:hypothetical protein
MNHSVQKFQKQSTHFNTNKLPHMKDRTAPFFALATTRYVGISLPHTSTVPKAANPCVSVPGMVQGLKTTGPQKQYFFMSPATSAWLTSFGEHSLHQCCPFQAYPVLA